MNTAKILVCEDDRVARELLDEILTREGHEVEALASGDDALGRARAAAAAGYGSR